MIAFYGMGMLGTGFVTALRRRDEEVRVWNRTPSKARALESTGATAFEDPAEAAKGAERIHLVLADDASVDDVLGKASPGFTKGITIVDHTTTSASGTKAREAKWRERGFTFVHAPVFMAPQHAHDASGIMLVSGDPARVDPVKPALAAMTGKLEYVGPKVEEAAALKLLGNMFLMFLTTGLADMLGLAKSLDVGPPGVKKLLALFNPGASAPVRLERITEGDFGSPSWELTMARKDARLMLEEAERGGVSLAILPTIAARMDAVIAQGHGGHDWTVIAKDFLPTK